MVRTILVFNSVAIHVMLDVNASRLLLLPPPPPATAVLFVCNPNAPLIIFLDCNGVAPLVRHYDLIHPAKNHYYIHDSASATYQDSSDTGAVTLCAPKEPADVRPYPEESLRPIQNDDNLGMSHGQEST